uniref:Putative secreted protein n=1 Tax=Anopheles darlingi TaxID=43151 RepID=A0A2M4DM27_ANODA
MRSVVSSIVSLCAPLSARNERCSWNGCGKPSPGTSSTANRTRSCVTSAQRLMVRRKRCARTTPTTGRRLHRPRPSSNGPWRW